MRTVLVILGSLTVALVFAYLFGVSIAVMVTDAGKVTPFRVGVASATAAVSIYHLAVAAGFAIKAERVDGIKS